MPDGGGIVSDLLPIAAAVATPFIGPELIPASLADVAGATTVADAVTGAALGAGSAALTGKDPLTGALTGGVAGGVAPNLGDIGNAVGLGGGSTAPDLTLGSGVSSTAPTASVDASGLAAPTTAALSPTSAVSAGPSAAAAPLGGAAGAGGAPVDLTSLTAGGGASGAAPINVDTSGLVAPGSAASTAPADLSSLTSSAPNAFGTGLPGAPTNPFSSTASPSIATAPIGTESLPAGTSFSTFANPTAVQDASIAATGAAPQGTLDSLLSKAGTQLTKNPLGALVSGAGLATNLASGNKLPKGTNQLSSQADQLAAQGTQLQSYLTSGTLPPGAQTALTSAANAAKQAVKSKYASLGLSGSTMEQQDLNNIDLQVQTEGFNMAANLLQQGVTDTNLSAQLYDDLVGINQKQNEQTGTAIANFASALNGGIPGVTIKAG